MARNVVQPIASLQPSTTSALSHRGCSELRTTNASTYWVDTKFERKQDELPLSRIELCQSILQVVRDNHAIARRVLKPFEYLTLCLLERLGDVRHSSPITRRADRVLVT